MVTTSFLPLTKVYFKIDMTNNTNKSASSEAMDVIKEWRESYDEDPINDVEILTDESNSFCACISFKTHDEANSFRRNMSYLEKDDKFKIVAFWHGIRASHEIIVNDVPQTANRRKIFEKFEKYGDIGRVTPCKSNQSQYFVAFISSKGAKNALKDKIEFEGTQLSVRKSIKIKSQ